MLGNGSPISTALGQLGSKFINDTGANTGLQVGVIYCVTDCAFSTLTSGKLPDGTTSVMAGTLASITLKAGQAIYGLFTAITLSSGSVIAYNV